MIDEQKRVYEFLKQYKIKEVSVKALLDAVKKLGYTVIYFNRHYNKESVQLVIDTLKLNNYAATTKCFTYADEDNRLLFINEDLNEEERRIVLAHEIGHIFCGHLNSGNIIGQDIKYEFEANEFAHYLLRPDKTAGFRFWIMRYKVIIAAVLILAIGIAVGIWYQYSYAYAFGEYYVTSGGEKYHDKDCIYIRDHSNVRKLTKKEFEADTYEPCAVCMPQK